MNVKDDKKENKTLKLSAAFAYDVCHCSKIGDWTQCIYNFRTITLR